MSRPVTEADIEQYTDQVVALLRPKLLAYAQRAALSGEVAPRPETLADELMGRMQRVLAAGDSGGSAP